MPTQREAQRTLFPRRRRRGRTPLGPLGPAGGIARALDTFLESVRQQHLSAQRAVVTAENVLQPQLNRVHAELFGDVVDLRLPGEGDLWIAEAAIRTETQLVGVDKPAVAAHMGKAVGPARAQQSE